MNVDGVGSGFDMAAMRQKLFSQMDQDESGGLDIDEFTEMFENRPQGVDDGKTAEDVFSEIDTDGDGVLSQDELDTHMANNPPPPPGGMMSSEMLLSLQQMLEEMDADENGTLSLDEFSAFYETEEEKRAEDVSEALSVEDIFSEIDTDGDGELSAEELNAHRMAMMTPQMSQRFETNGMGALLAAQEAA